MPYPIELRTLSEQDIGRCRDILYSLPDWFGIEESNQAYVRSLSELPGAVACLDERIVGFIALAEHTPSSFEIHVMAVEPEFHRRGAGQALIRWAETACQARGARWLHVKTRGPSTPDPAYARTRAFYSACGFEPLFETLELWGPENAALIMVKLCSYGDGRTMQAHPSGFPAGEENAHHLKDDTQHPASYLEIGSRRPGEDVVHYPDDDLGPIRR